MSAVRVTRALAVGTVSALAWLALFGLLGAVAQEVVVALCVIGWLCALDNG